MTGTPQPIRKTIPVKRQAGPPPKEVKKEKSGFRAFFGFGKKKKAPTHNVGAPCNVTHNVHVDFTAKSGFVGLPSEWEAALISSGVNKKIYLYTY